MKLSDKLRSRRWKSHPLTMGGHAWEDDDAPLHAGDCLEKCEMLFEEVLRSVTKANGSGDKNSLDAVENSIRAMLLGLRSEPLPVAAYYVLEDGKRRALPSNVEEAIDVIREEFIAGHSHGVLRVKEPVEIHVGGPLHASGEKDWATFELEARAWLTRVNAVLLEKKIQKDC
jgi:hypothetical protein